MEDIHPLSFIFSVLSPPQRFTTTGEMQDTKHSSTQLSGDVHPDAAKDSTGICSEEAKVVAQFTALLLSSMLPAGKLLLAQSLFLLTLQNIPDDYFSSQRSPRSSYQVKQYPLPPYPSCHWENRLASSSHVLRLVFKSYGFTKSNAFSKPQILFSGTIN